MRLQSLARALMLGGLMLTGGPATAANEAASPPMGWNSWDAYGFTLDEQAFKANALKLAELRSYGWTYAVIDEGWYMDNPAGANLAQRRYQLNAGGLLIPTLKRYASAADGAGFRPLADWAHSRGLKFGLHIVRGIPKQAVESNAPISGTAFHAADAADTHETCPWDDGNFGVRDNPAGQAYYDSMLRLYAQWGVDFLKVDCISAHPFRATEIHQIHEAIQKSGRPIVLSLSPGPTALEQENFVKRNAQMWRISNERSGTVGDSPVTPILRASPLACPAPLTTWPNGIPSQGRAHGPTQTCCRSAPSNPTPAGAIRGPAV